MRCTTQVTLIEIVGAFVPIEGAFNIEVAKVDVTVQKDLPDPFGLISGNAKALLLCKSERWVRGSDSDDAWMVQFVLSLG